MRQNHLGCQDTYYVGNFKGIGKVYAQVFIDSYSRFADAKLYNEKTAITAAISCSEKRKIYSEILRVSKEVYSKKARLNEARSPVLRQSATSGARPTCRVE